MTATAVQVRNSKAVEYLELLRSMASEMEIAMRAIARNALPDLEESIASQQDMSARLLVLANEMSPTLDAALSAPQAGTDSDVLLQVRVAGDALQNLNRRYAALLQHSSRSVALMASLFNSYKGQFTEASGPRLKQQTWSCQM